MKTGRRSFYDTLFNRKTLKKVAIIAFMICAIIYLHYFTYPDLRHQHAVYRMLFYLPLILGSFWFGLKGAMVVSFGVSILYLPYVLEHWQGWSLEDFDRLLEGILCVAIAFILGFLVEKERKLHNALLRSESLAAVGHGVSEIAHDMKTPLVAIGGFAKQVFRVIDQEDPNRLSRLRFSGPHAIRLASWTMSRNHGSCGGRRTEPPARPA